MIFGADIPFPSHCGIEEAGIVDGGTRLRLRPRPFHRNNIGIAHGGVLCTLLDVAMGSTCRVRFGKPVMTLDMQVSFLSPGRGVLIAAGRILKAGRSLIYAEATIFTEEDETLVAKGSGIFKTVEERTAAGA